MLLATGLVFGLLGLIIGSRLILSTLVKLASIADRLDRLWKHGVLLEAEDVQFEEKEAKDGEGLSSGIILGANRGVC